MLSFVALDRTHRTFTTSDLLPLTLFFYNQAYDALRPGGVFVVHDFMVNDERDGPPLAALWALQHMVFTPGAISLTPAAVTGFMENAGFDDIEFFTMIPGMTQGAIGIKK